MNYLGTPLREIITDFYNPEPTDMLVWENASDPSPMLRKVAYRCRGLTVVVDHENGGGLVFNHVAAVPGSSGAVEVSRERLVADLSIAKDTNRRLVFQARSMRCKIDELCKELEEVHQDNSKKAGLITSLQAKLKAYSHRG